jgi:hypothetical protein
MPEEITDRPLDYDLLAKTKAPDILASAAATNISHEQFRSGVMRAYDDLKTLYPASQIQEFMPYIEYYLGGLRHSRGDLVRMESGIRNTPEAHLMNARLQQHQVRHLLYATLGENVDEAYKAKVLANLVTHHNLARRRGEDKIAGAPAFFNGVMGEAAVARLFHDSGYQVFLPSPSDEEETRILDVESGIDLLAVTVDHNGRSHVIPANAKAEYYEGGGMGGSVRRTIDVRSRPLSDDEIGRLPAPLKTFVDNNDYGNGVSVHRASIFVPTSPDHLTSVTQAFTDHRNEGINAVLQNIATIRSPGIQTSFRNQMNAHMTGSSS